MSKKDKHLMQIKYIVLGKSLVIGFFGGMFVSLFLGLLFYFNIVEVNIFTLWKAIFTRLNLSTKWYVYLIWIIGYSLLSIIFSLVYFLIGKNRNHWDIGALYGFVIAVIVYLFLPILLYDQHFLLNYELKTHIGFFVAFILYGIFIGYSISYEYARMKKNLKQYHFLS